MRWLALVAFLLPFSAFGQVGPGGGGGGGGGCTTNCTFSGTTTMGAVQATTLGATGLSTTAGISDSGGINTTSTIKLSGVPVIGSGLSSSAGPSVGPGFIFVATWDHSTLGADTRQNQLLTFLNPSVNTNNIWENFNSFVTLSGPGVAQGEINVMHSGFTVNAGASSNSAEDHESSMFNLGTIGSFADYNALAHNGTTGTATNLTGVTAQLTNDNTAVGSVAGWGAYFCKTMGGAGSLPTANYCLRNDDANQQIGSAGGATFGQIASGGGILNAFGKDTNPFSLNAGFYDHSGAYVAWISNGGLAGFGSAGIGATFAALTIGDHGGAATYGAHIAVTQTTAPTIIVGTASLDANASDVAGVVTEGTTQTGFTLRFTVAYHTAPHCLVSGLNGVTPTSVTVNTTGLAITNPSASGDVFSYSCIQ